MYYFSMVRMDVCVGGVGGDHLLASCQTCNDFNHWLAHRKIVCPIEMDSGPENRKKGLNKWNIDCVKKTGGQPVGQKTKIQSIKATIA